MTSHLTMSVALSLLGLRPFLWATAHPSFRGLMIAVGTGSELVRPSVGSTGPADDAKVRKDYPIETGIVDIY